MKDLYIPICVFHECEDENCMNIKMIHLMSNDELDGYQYSIGLVIDK
jgi:hypothetical protein